MTTLTDREIETDLIEKGHIKNADNTRLSGACYELRMGSVYYDLTEGGKRFQMAPSETVIVKPGHRVVLITAEEVDIPDDIFVRIVCKGSLFSIGLSPVATHADPGFKGHLGIVTENVSDKYIVLEQGEPIAKADFTRLRQSARKPYRGQHGFQAGIWPLRLHLQKTHAEVAADPRVKSEEDEALALLPAATRLAIRQLQETQFYTNLGLLIAIGFNGVALFVASGKFADSFFGVVGNLIASAITALCVLLYSYTRRNRL